MLDNCRSTLGEIRSIRERIERLRSDRERMTQTITGMPGGGKGSEQNRIEATTAKLLELEEELAERLVKREGEVYEVERWIETLRPQQWRAVIRLRYVEGIPWRQIERRTNYSKEGIMKINRCVRKRVHQSTPKSVK